MNVPISKTFKRSARTTVWYIVLFIFTYFILLLLSIILTFLCLYYGVKIMLISFFVPSLLLGVVMILLGLSIFYFLIKFIFSKNNRKENSSFEITAEDEPALFSLINAVADEVNTSYPEKVVLSHEVNACVYYDTSIWKVFLPIRKNLQIGIGLMNTLTQQEFKSVLAHEFGHFSQNSMQTGHYVYQVNRILYNLLYKNNSLTEINVKLKRMNKWIAAGLDFALFVIIGIQKILGILYRQINLSYHKLSREMEFHADNIASQIAGSSASSKALMRIPFAAHTLELTLAFYEEKLKDNIISNNLFEDHLALLNYIAKRNDYPIINGFPMVNISNVNKYNRSKINFENPWDTHPDLKTRVEAINQLGIKTENEVEKPAILLFKDPKSRLETFTKQLFTPYLATESASIWNTDKFIEYYQTQIEKDDLSPIYRGYFDICNPYLEKLPDVSIDDKITSLSFLFFDERQDVLYAWNGLLIDLGILNSILNGDLEINTFTYDQKLYHQSDVPKVKKVIEENMERLELLMKIQMEDIYKFFLQQAELAEQKVKIKKLYEDFKLSQEEYLFDFEIYSRMMKQIAIFQIDFEEQIDLSALSTFKKTEQLFKNRLNVFLQLKYLKENTSVSVWNMMEEYISNEMPYYHTDKEGFNQDNVNKLITCLIHFNTFIEKLFYQKKKYLLDFQSNLIKPVA